MQGMIMDHAPMSRQKVSISLRGMAKRLSWTFFGTLACVLISVSYNYFIFQSHRPETLHKALWSATVLPIVLAGPLFYYLTKKLRELAIVNHRLTDIAATDSLTECLNRRAFTRNVDQWLSHPDDERKVAVGALLIIDADHFKAVNDRFGHQRGDEALKLIAAAIKDVVRSRDSVGRLGGEEFGIFLPDAAPQRAAIVAERVRRAVSEAEFLPDGVRWRLTVSVGAVVFTQPTNFSELFKIADERLYLAKEMGRNRVEIKHLVPSHPEASLNIH
jgi:diguanylate cyclase